MRQMAAASRRRLRMSSPYHAFVDEQASHGGYFEDYSFWAVSVGVNFQVPPQPWPDLW
jgi:hypothetical protein